jgi:rod shape determining protein RodA
MRHIIGFIRNFFRKGDMILLTLCLVTTAFGCMVIASATNNLGFTRYIIIQLVATALGVVCYAVISSLDTDFLAEYRTGMVIFNLFLIALLIPFGINVGGNRSWLDFPLLPVNIQAAEVCKITFIIIMASVMGSHQNRPSHIISVLHLAFHLLLFVGPNLVISGDMGVSLIFVFIFIGMAFAGGVNALWFLGGIGAISAGFPILWTRLGEYQRNRILILFDPTIDPTGIGPRYHTRLSLQSLTGGGLLGQGLFQGTRTQTPEALPAQHTDFIFSAIGEELGYAGCAFVMFLLLLIIIRCIYVGMHAQDYMRRLVCFGAASALIFQVIINVGMCIGVMPVIGITLPFISYGGSSIVTLYAMLGLVSGVHERPAAASHERYIRSPYLRR